MNDFFTRETPAFPVPDVLTPDEAAALLRIHKYTLFIRCKSHGIPHQRIGRHYRFSRSALLEWLAKVPT